MAKKSSSDSKSMSMIKGKSMIKGESLIKAPSLPSVKPDDIAAFIESQNVEDLTDLLKTDSGMDTSLKPFSKKALKKAAKVEKRHQQQHHQQQQQQEDEEEQQKEKNDDEGKQSQIQHGKVLEHLNTDDLLNMEEEAEMKAYLEIKREERRKAKLLAAAAKTLKKGEEEEDDEEEEEDEEMDEDEDENDMDDEDENSVDVGLTQKKSKIFVNDKAGLLSRLAHIRLKGPGKSLAWIEFQDVTVPQHLDPKEVDDDLKREMTFYGQALAAVKEGFRRLKDSKIPIHRPLDYYAEMIKSDEHMMRIKKKLLEETQAMENSERAKELRHAKKFGKKVQQEKLAEREKSKRDELEKVKLLRKKSNSKANNPDGDNDDDDFGISLDTTDDSKKNGGKSNGGAGKTDVNRKRQTKDSKYGFGGKKRFAKSNTRDSTDDLSSFNPKKMKSGGGRGRSSAGSKVNSYGGKPTRGGGGIVKKNRPGKARRQQSR